MDYYIIISKVFIYVVALWFALGTNIFENIGEQRKSVQKSRIFQLKGIVCQTAVDSDAAGEAGQSC